MICPACRTETYLSSAGLHGLLPDYAVTNIVEEQTFDRSNLTCGGCKGGQDGNGGTDAMVVAHCYNCSNFLCESCELAHRYMHCFEGHQVASVADLHSGQQFKVGKTVKCQRHRAENLIYFCRSCNVPICKECTLIEHAKGHEYYYLAEVANVEIDTMVRMAKQATIKAVDLRGASKNVEQSSVYLQQQYAKAKNSINETFNFFCTMLEDRRQSLMRELDMAFNDKQVMLSTTAQEMQEFMTKVTRACQFINKLVLHASNTEALVCKSMIESKLRAVIDYTPEAGDCPNTYDIEFASNHQSIQAAVRNSFGFIRQSRNGPTFRRPSQTMIENLVAAARLSSFDLNNGVGMNGGAALNGINGHHDGVQNGLMNGSSMPPGLDADYSKWGGDSNGAITTNGGPQHGGDIFAQADMFTLGSNPVAEKPRNNDNDLAPLKSQLPRTKMVYNHKFGEFGSSNGQFTEPSGVAVNHNGDILVADTNNHRIQVFDRNGDFKFHFGQCGKRDGQLLYPNRVTVCKLTGNIIVTERSPTHQVQIFTSDGMFVRKFGSNKLQHPRGVTVDNKGRIVIVECKVMRVIIFDQMGNELYKFGCSKHLEFPNGVVVNDKEEIFISDNRSHCVKVFSYTGVYLRQIGGEGLTNYPIGVGINAAGEILVADNHNNFNVTVFKQDGNIVAALESRVKHAQCFDVALGEEGSIVLASRDFRIYIYHYSGSSVVNGGNASPPLSNSSVCSTPNFLLQQQPEFHNWFDAKLSI